MYNKSGGWNRQKNCKIYQNGVWTDLWDGYYFREGEQYAGVTGGWTSTGWNNSGTVTLGSTIVLSGDSTKTAIVGTAQTVDLTDANTLWFDSPKGNNGQPYGGYLCVTSAKSIATADIVTYAAINKSGKGNIDVSGLSGKYYICLYALAHTAGTAYADVSAVWME